MRELAKAVVDSSVGHLEAQFWLPYIPSLQHSKHYLVDIRNQSHCDKGHLPRHNICGIGIWN